MLKTKSFLCLDFGAGSLKMAEFESAEEGQLRLLQFGVRSLGFEGSQDVARERVLLKAIQELLAEKPYAARSINACAPGFHVFSKFVRLPPVDASKVSQIIQYEARQNIPFPLEEVVWDFQILGTSPSGELEVFLVAIKSDQVESMFRTADAAGLRVQLVDVSPAALCNAFRYNYGDLDGCAMLLDIGARTSNVLFFEKGKVYCRGINIGANSITQEFAAEAKLKFGEAEQAKIAEGFVSLGGAYEEPDNPRQAQISKIARQVMTRLHIQVNQTIQFYRGQQGGSAPQRVYLTGGASVMAYTAQFFGEKLGIPVEYFNPFRNVDIDPGIDREELARVAHAFGEVVGLGLRSVVQCPVEMNLMPKSYVQRQQFIQKRPYLAAAVASLALVILAFGFSLARLSGIKAESSRDITERIRDPQQKEKTLLAELGKVTKTQGQIQQLQQWNQERFYWSDLLAELREIFLQTEAARAEAMSGVANGLWIESFASPTPGLTTEPTGLTAQAKPDVASSVYSQRMLERYGLLKPTTPTTTDATTGTSETSTNEISTVRLTCRAVNLRRFSPTANDELAYALQAALLTNPRFSTNGTRLSGQIEPVDESALTFSFGVTLKLSQPLKL